MLGKPLSLLKFDKVRVNTAKLDPSKVPVETLAGVIRWLERIRARPETVYSPETVCSALEELIATVLSTVTEADEHHFRAAKAADLNCLLHANSERCIVAAINAIAVVGTEGNIHALNEVISRAATPGRGEEIRQHAERCLKDLATRLSNREAQVTLLRPAVLHRSRELLRPASTFHDAADDQIDNEELLRGTATDDLAK